MQPSHSSKNGSKGRACDQCRARKVACSKEPSGCSRCVQENTRCFYSAQKTMGRPRTRYLDGEFKETSITETSSNIADQSHIALHSITREDDLETTSLEEKRCSDPNIAEIVGEAQNFRRDGFNATPADDDHNGLVPLLPALSDVRNNRMMAQSTPILEEFQCSCLASMYLAMASLQELPNEVISALATVRVAANAAQSMIRCPQCGVADVRDDFPSVESFQNTMMLGTILPTIINAYKRLFSKVDFETELAIESGSKKLSPMVKVSDEYGTNELLDPREWKSIMLNFLMVDLYGFENSSTGLKGMIGEMEIRQRIRHRDWHIIHKVGILGSGSSKPCSGEKDALCLRLVDAARAALDGLVVT